MHSNALPRVILIPAHIQVTDRLYILCRTDGGVRRNEQYAVTERNGGYKTIHGASE